MKRRRNRKKKANGFLFPAPFAGMLVLAATLAIVYVWLGCRCDALGRELKALERQQRDIQVRCEAQESRWARLRSPASVKRELVRHNIVMGWPKLDQIVRISRSEAKHGSDRRWLSTALTQVARDGVVMND